MMKQVILTILFCYLLSIKKGLGLVTFSDPPSGSVVANFKGALNATTLTCNVSNSTGHQITSVWTIKDFRNSSGREVITRVAPDLFYVDSDPNTQPGAKFGNRLTILNFMSELDGETVYCGTEANPEEAIFTLRVYRNNLGHSTNKAIAIIFGLLGGIFILGFLVAIVGFAIKRTLRKRDGVDRNYEPHFQRYSDHLLKQFATIRQPKKHAFTDGHVYPSLVDPGNNSAEYSVHDL